MGRKEKVTRVIDGDTFKTRSRKQSVRLADVKAPEIGTSGAARATAALRKMIQGKDVIVDTVTRDKYGRSVARVKVQGKSVNRAMQKQVGTSGAKRTVRSAKGSATLPRSTVARAVEKVASRRRR